MAGAAAAVAALGLRLISPRACLASGLTLAVLPQVSLYAQDAREYAMITALAATGSYLLVRALTTPLGSRRWLVGYAFCLGFMGLLNVFSLLLIGAHAITVALAWRRAGAAGRGREFRALAAGWAVAVAGALLLASPALAFGFGQRHTLGWIPTPHLVAAVVGLRRLVGSVPDAARRRGGGRARHHAARGHRPGPAAGWLAPGAVRALPAVAAAAACGADRRVLCLTRVHVPRT